MFAVQMVAYVKKARHFQALHVEAESPKDAATKALQRLPIAYSFDRVIVTVQSVPPAPLCCMYYEFEVGADNRFHLRKEV